MDTLDGLYTDDFTLTQPIGGVANTVKVIKQVNVITQKKAKRNVHNKRSRCSNTLDWVEVETGVKYRKLGKNEKGGY